MPLKRSWWPALWRWKKQGLACQQRKWNDRDRALQLPGLMASFQSLHERSDGSKQCIPAIYRQLHMEFVLFPRADQHRHQRPSMHQLSSSMLTSVTSPQLLMVTSS